MLYSLQFADDTALVAVGPNVDFALNRAERGIKAVHKFAQDWKIELNHSKTEAILFGRKRPRTKSLCFERRSIKLRSEVTYLGVTFDRQMTFESHARRRKHVALSRLRTLYCLTTPNSGLSNRNRLRLANSIAIPAAVYGQEVWVTGTLRASSIITTAQNQIYRRVLGAPWYIRNDDIRWEVEADDLRESAWKRRRAMIEALKSHVRDDVVEVGTFIEDVGPLG